MRDKLIKIITEAEEQFTNQIMHNKYDNPDDIPNRIEMIADKILESGAIIRQQTEIERYKGVIKLLEKDVKTAKDDAIKEFGHMLIDKAKNGDISAGDIPDYVQEMVGDTV